MTQDRVCNALLNVFVLSKKGTKLICSLEKLKSGTAVCLGVIMQCFVSLCRGFASLKLPIDFSVAMERQKATAFNDK